MRNLMIVITTCSAVGLVASAAYGEVKFLDGKYGRPEIKSACDAAGGQYFDEPNIPGITEPKYGCQKSNCDGKGGNCTVTCNSQQLCTGVTPLAHGQKLKTPKQVLGLAKSLSGGKSVRLPSKSTTIKGR